MEGNNARKYQCETEPNYLTQPVRHPGQQYLQWPQSSSQKLSVSRRASSSTGGAGNKPSPSHSSPFTRPAPNQPFTENVIDPSLETISSFSSFPSHASSNSVANPLHRFYLESESPWNSVRSFGSSLAIPDRGPPFPAVLDLNYRSGPSSEIESHETGPYASDSGYGTIDCTSQSVYNHSQPESSQDCSDLPYRVESMQPFQDTASSVSADTKDMVVKPFDRGSNVKFSSSSNRSRLVEKCKHCGAQPKCPSDFKKHMLKHEKPFKCTFPGCKKKGGFTTVNDRRRHEKSVHKIGTAEKSYRCASLQCKNRHKIWPRLDNFKQHVSRMHPGEDVNDFIKRSQWDGKPSRSPTPRASAIVAPMETTLAGIDDPSKHAGIGIFPSPSGFQMSFDHSPKGWDSAAPNPQTLDFEDSQNEISDMTFAYNHGAGAARARESTLRSDTVSTASSSGLNALADAACGSGLNPPDPSPRPGSRRPQPLTRPKESDEERQKRALDKLSNAIADGITSSTRTPGESLNEIILRILTSATGLQLATNYSGTSSSFPSIDKSSLPGEPQKIKAMDNKLLDSIKTHVDRSCVAPDDVAQSLADLAALLKKQRPKKANNINNARLNAGKPADVKQCPVCNLPFNRNCDLKKHMKRHNKPYGCTYPKCNKVFGSKSDWKRHENSQHFQIETWRCQVVLAPVSEHHSHAAQHCGSLFFRQEQFREHLKSHHELADIHFVEEEIKRRRIGRNGQGRFWCGFCGDIVVLRQKRMAAWDERFNHIDNHFKQGCNSRDWWCMEAKKMKGEVAKLMNKDNFGDEGDEGDEDDDDEREGEGEESVNSHEIGVVESTSTSPNSTGSNDSASPSLELAPSYNPRKRLRSRDPSATPRTRRKYQALLFCCVCTMGPFDRKMYEQCVSCDHKFCSRCNKMTHELQGNDELDFQLPGQKHE